MNDGNEPETDSVLRQWISAYRRQYAKLPPAVQLVGLQMWLPAVFIVMFCSCYIVAFHAPSPRHAPVAVVAPADSAIVHTLRQATGQTVDYRSYRRAGAAKEAVREGTVIAALVNPAGSDPTLYVAKAHQFQAATLAATVMRPVYSAMRQQLAVDDLAPLPAHDFFGMTTMYLMLSWCIGGYMVAMFIGLMGAPLRHRTRVLIIVGGAVVVSLLANTLAGPVIGAVDGHFWQLVPMAIGWIIAIGLMVNGLSYFAGRFIALPAILIFVFLSIPSSGAGYPTWMLPSLFQRLQPYVVGFGMTEMIKRTLYGVGEPYAKGLILMAGYAVLGLLLMAAGKPWHERREVRRILSGRTTMMADAQAANREHQAAIRERVLAHYGVASPDDEAARDEDELAETPSPRTGVPCPTFSRRTGPAATVTADSPRRRRRLRYLPRARTGRSRPHGTQRVLLR